MRLLILLMLVAAPGWGAYGYRKSITVGAAVVTSGPHNNFRMLVSGTDTDLRVTGSGGRVQHASGYDIDYFTNSDCSTGRLPYHRIAWNGTTGAYIHKVKVDVANSLLIYRCYGDSGISADQSQPTSVYVSSVGGAWQLEDNAANTTVADATSNSATGTAAANTSTKTVTGKIGSGLTFNGTSDVVTVANNATLNASTGLTITAWVKRLVTGTSNRIVFKDNTAGTHFVYGMQFSTADKLEGLVSDGTASPTNVRYCAGATSVTSTAVFQHVAVTYNATGSAMAVYLNGASDVSGQPGLTGCNAGTTYSGNLTSSTGTLEMGRLIFDSASYYGNIELDDLEIENVVRSTGWITTEYTNENNPGAFYTVGSEEPLSGSTRRRVIVIQ